MQACPLLKNDIGRIDAIDCSIGASSSSTAAALPPSSSVNRLNVPAHASEMARPASVLPVNTTRSTPSWATSAAPTSAPPGTMFTTPGGMPAASAASASTNASSGVSAAGLNTIGHPDASAGASLAAADMIGPLNGTTAPTTPTGSRTTSAGASAPWRTSRHGKARVSCSK